MSVALEVESFDKQHLQTQ